MEALGSIDPEIDAESSPGDREVGLLAARQHGIVARRQLVALGLGEGAIDNRVSSGRLHPLYRGIYAVGHRSISRQGRWMAAVLAAGPNAVLSHGSAAALWDLQSTSSQRIDVTAPRARREQDGFRLHRVRRLDPADRAVEEGIPVTSVHRTLLDLAELDEPQRLRRALENAENLWLLSLREMDDLLARSPGRRGRRPLMRALAELRPAAPITRSALERRFHEICRREGLPLPDLNMWVCGMEVDAVWEEGRLVAELDGYEYHRDRRAFERDRVRDTSLQLAGYRVVRITHRRLETEPAAIVAELRAFLGAR